MRGRTTDFWVVGAAFFVSGSQLLSMLVAPLSFAVATDIDAEPKDSGATMEFDVEIVVVSALVAGGVGNSTHRRCRRDACRSPQAF
jgi:tetraacyldisaccharide-1-P 4'-kinase